MIGFFIGIVLSFLVYFFQKLPQVGQQESSKVQRKLERIQRKRDIEAVESGDAAFTQGGKKVRRRVTENTDSESNSGETDEGEYGHP